MNCRQQTLLLRFARLVRCVFSPVGRAELEVEWKWEHERRRGGEGEWHGQGSDEEEWGRGGKCLCIGSQPMHVLFFQRRDVKRMFLTVTQRQLQGHTNKSSHLFLQCTVMYLKVCDFIWVVSSTVTPLLFICYIISRKRKILKVSLAGVVSISPNMTSHGWFVRIQFVRSL